MCSLGFGFIVSVVVTLLDTVSFIPELDRANVNHGLEERLAVVMCGSPTTVLQPFTTQYDDIRGILGTQISSYIAMKTMITMKAIRLFKFIFLL